ncbi:MAG: ribonuclease HII [Patescibacteria group bacterium]
MHIIGVDEVGRAALLRRASPQRTYSVGVDEVGRGALAGPLVAAAVRVIDTRHFPYSDVTDSKLLSDQERRTALVQILKTAQVAYGIVSHQTIDRLGIQQANVLAVDRALRPFLGEQAEVHSDYIGSFEALTTVPATVTLHVHGELAMPEIAAASIAAKVFRDDIMVRLSDLLPQYLFSKHKGYGTREHIRAVKRYGRSSYHRMSFQY